MRLTRLFALCFTVVAACADSTGPSAQPSLITALPRQLSGAEQAIVSATPQFGFGLFRAVNRTFADSNVFISPLSASMALGMTLNGAAGATYDEMRTSLGLPDRPLAELNGGYRALIDLLRSIDKTVDFRIANSIWYRSTFGSAIAPVFLADTKASFDAQVSALDFKSPSAPATINTWVKSSTNGKIDKIIDRIPDNMVMYLINAIYFKGAWRDPFDPKQTANAGFVAPGGQRLQVPTMTRKGKYRAALVGGTQVVELPYGGDAFVMTIAMPAEGTSINTFVSDLTPTSWQTLTATLGASSNDLYLPKFKLEWSDKLNDELQAMGMRQPFVEGGADFTRLSPSIGRDLFISEVKQKTFVDVNEEGTEAAAVTSVGIGVTSLPVAIRIDRPFVFAIRERLTGTLLFLGKIVKPVV